ncbi:hypothetical protein [Luteibacter aegosomatissinici]|uniref:hypothetical protein n=1 Tax=Luteibacter aegosomatissinici TaxID=2911539 RepID=UPI001FFABBCE|nr:hypothetical protein [Luteibacter aegosomatissinici]UPG93339.1 hypothetical protein L2Y97_15955 [Luteibacter aegosomatissinici]
MTQRIVSRSKRLRNRGSLGMGARYRSAHDQHIETRVLDLETSVGDIRHRLTRIETTLGHVATAESMAQLSSELRQAIEAQGTRAEGIRADLITRIEGSRSDLTKHIEGVRSEMTAHIEGVRSDLTKWFVTVAMTLAAVAFAAAKYTH